MRPSRSGSQIALLASMASAAHGLARWLVLLLLVFDQFSAPWHTHHHDNGVDGIAVAAVHADGLQSQVLGETHVEAPDHRSTWAHANTLLRSAVGLSLTMGGGDNDDGHVSLWPIARLTPAIKEPSRPAIAARQELPTPAYRSLRPSPQAPPWRA